MLTTLRRIRILATLASLMLLLVFALVPIVAIAESPPLFRLDRCPDTPLPELGVRVSHENHVLKRYIHQAGARSRSQEPEAQPLRR